ncbi:MAG TPA: hypothetical protein VNU23_11135 [Candidatus Cybelea sp.]|jgi:hypothetical protein|nr:hypothetical protein [Candidatus Cybelea sp.]
MQASQKMFTPRPESTGQSFPSATHLSYQIGGITFGLHAEGDLLLSPERELSAFAVEPGSADVNLQVSWADSLKAPSSTPLFHSGGLWSLFAETSGYRFSFLSPLLGMTPYKEAWLDSEFRSGRVLLSRRFFDTDRPVYPLEYPLDELLMIHRLSQGEGVEVHAVGISDENGRGHLFLGHSGAGKSTTARLWLDRPGVRILSDDRIILRARDGQIWMYGTPWHGDAGIASPDSALLTGIYLLEHGNSNEQFLLPPGRAAAELFTRSFVTHHSGEGIRFTLEFLDRVARAVPCSIFKFVPDESAVEAICRAGA